MNPEGNAYSGRSSTSKETEKKTASSKQTGKQNSTAEEKRNGVAFTRDTGSPQADGKVESWGLQPKKKMPEPHFHASASWLLPAAGFLSFSARLRGTLRSICISWVPLVAMSLVPSGVFTLKVRWSNFTSTPGTGFLSHIKCANKDKSYPVTKNQKISVILGGKWFSFKLTPYVCSKKNVCINAHTGGF